VQERIVANLEGASTERLVSIVMPTYNQDRFIGKAVASVLDQSYSNWELLVINNFSSDNTRQVVESFADKRIKLFDFANLGVIAASRNYGIKASAGTLLAFLDSDDYWHPEKLKQCLEKLDSGYDLVCHGEIFFNDGADKFTATKYGPEERCHFQEMMTRGNCLSTSAILVKKVVLDKSGLFDESHDLITAEDFDLWLRIAKSGAKMGILDLMLGHYRLHNTSASASNLRNAKATLAALKRNLFDSNLSILSRFCAAIFRARIRFFIMRSEYRER
jgi:teichuronic acid biosynthesis glycosyltransferase TuaG